jgi:hypothetical protein
MHLRETPGESTFLIDQEQAFYDVKNFEVTYVPEGYELVEDVVLNDFVRRMKYQNETGDGIKIHIMKTEQFGANVDNERLVGTEVMVNGIQAHIFEYNHRTICTSIFINRWIYI